MAVDVSEYENGTARPVFPILPIPILSQVCKSAQSVFISEGNVLRINQEVVIVGDLHGHILDLFRIFRKFGHPPRQTYLFLGDIVDRGEFSAETAISIIVAKALFPKNVFVIRGNHEFRDMWASSGFSLQLKEIYDDKAELAECEFAKVFSYLPLAAIINNDSICVHGGIGPEFNDFHYLDSVQRPLDEVEDEVLSSLLWSDPSDETVEWDESPRGSGYLFGKAPLKKFLEANELSLMIRGHQCIENGVEYSLDNKIVTVFSASNYCGTKNNIAGVLIIKTDNTRQIVTFPALKYIMRYEASFLTSASENNFQLTSKIVKKVNAPPSPMALSNNPQQFSTFSPSQNQQIFSPTEPSIPYEQSPQIPHRSSNLSPSQLLPKAPSRPSTSPRRLRRKDKSNNSCNSFSFSTRTSGNSSDLASTPLSLSKDFSALTRSQPLLIFPSPSKKRKKDDDITRKGANSIMMTPKKNDDSSYIRQKRAYPY